MFAKTNCLYLEVLGFLLEYERVADPGEDEADAWLESTASSTQRPFPTAVARRRLPLSWLVKMPPKMKYRDGRNSMVFY